MYMRWFSFLKKRGSHHMYLRTMAARMELNVLSDSFRNCWLLYRVSTPGVGQMQNIWPLFSKNVLSSK